MVCLTVPGSGLTSLHRRRTFQFRKTGGLRILPLDMQQEKEMRETGHNPADIFNKLNYFLDPGKVVIKRS